MILVKHGYTLSTYPPTTYNYRYQEIPTTISRQKPIPQMTRDEDYMIKLSTAEGVGIYMADSPSPDMYDSLDITIYLVNSSTGNVTAQHYYYDTDRTYEETQGIRYIPMLNGERYTESGRTFSSWHELPTFRLWCSGVYSLGSGGGKVYAAKSRMEIRGRSSLPTNPYWTSTAFRDQYVRVAPSDDTQSEYFYTVTGGIVGG